MAFGTELLLFSKHSFHSNELSLQPKLLLLEYFKRRATGRAAGNRGTGCLHPLFGTWIRILNQVEATPHQGAAADLINHLGLHPLLKLHSKVLEQPGQQKPIPKIMLLGGICNASYVSDHDCRKIDLLASIHEISEALIHGIRLIVPMTPRNDVLDNEPEQELMEWFHIPFLH